MPPRRPTLKHCLQILLTLCRQGASWSLRGLLHILSYIHQHRRLSKADFDDDNEAHLPRAISSDRSDKPSVGHAGVLLAPTTPTTPPSVCLQDQSGSPNGPYSSSAIPSSQQGGLLQIGNGMEHGRSNLPATTVTLSPGSVCMAESLKPIVPSHVQHYERDVTIENIRGPWVLKPIEMLKFADLREQYPASWKYHVHPEGNPYFSYEDEMHTCRFRYLTEANPSTQSIRKDLERCMNAIKSRTRELELSSNVDVVLERQDGEWCYYMIDLDQRAVFWLDEYDMSKIIPRDEGIEIKHHLCHKLQYEYWQHIEYFPISAPKDTEEFFDELMDTLEFYNFDCITTRESTVPYSKDDLQSIIGSIKYMKSSNSTKRSDHAIVALARMASIIEHERHLNFYGFEGARLVFDQSVRGNSPMRRSWFMKCLSFLLFHSPDTYLRYIERNFIDCVARLQKWEVLHEKLKMDWNMTVLSSTVLLNANVAFLAIPNVSSDENAVFWSSPAAAASLVSTVASLMCIIISLLLVRQHYIDARGEESSAKDALRFLRRRRHTQLGMETLAIQYSLPYALLMYGFLSFTAAIAIICFYEVNTTPNFATRIVYIIVWFSLSLLVLWTLINTSRRDWRDLISKKWWIEHIMSVATWLRRRHRGLMRWAKGGSEDDISLGETGSINDATGEPSRARLWMRFGPVRHLTETLPRMSS